MIGGAGAGNEQAALQEKVSELENVSQELASYRSRALAAEDGLQRLRDDSHEAQATATEDSQATATEVAELKNQLEQQRAAADAEIEQVQGQLRVRFHIIRNACIVYVGEYQSCMVSKVRIIWKQTVSQAQAQAQALLKQEANSDADASSLAQQRGEELASANEQLSVAQRERSELQVREHLPTGACGYNRPFEIMHD